LSKHNKIKNNTARNKGRRAKETSRTHPLAPSLFLKGKREGLLCRDLMKILLP
jgi:hypothetical protein